MQVQFTLLPARLPDMAHRDNMGSSGQRRHQRSTFVSRDLPKSPLGIVADAGKRVSHVRFLSSVRSSVRVPLFRWRLVNGDAAAARQHPLRGAAVYPRKSTLAFVISVLRSPCSLQSMFMTAATRKRVLEIPLRRYIRRSWQKNSRMPAVNESLIA